jgi:hypothetical protein
MGMIVKSSSLYSSHLRVCSGPNSVEEMRERREQGHFNSFWPNTSQGLLSFMFVSDKSFKFLKFQTCPLSFEFVSDRSFKFLRFQIGPLSF